MDKNIFVLCKEFDRRLLTLYHRIARLDDPGTLDQGTIVVIDPKVFQSPAFTISIELKISS